MNWHEEGFGEAGRSPDTLCRNLRQETGRSQDALCRDFREEAGSRPDALCRDLREEAGRNPGAINLANQKLREVFTMGKPTGFMDYKRQDKTAEAPESRIRHFQEFHTPLSREEQEIQGARLSLIHI